LKTSGGLAEEQFRTPPMAARGFPDGFPKPVLEDNIMLWIE
jgi:hypothetical protein